MVRKTVTVLFCDVVTSTELGGRLDPESWRRVMSRYFAEMEAVIARHGGTTEKFIGDAVMAVFGVPVVHEDDALRAVRAAWQMRERLDELNDELEPTWGVRFRMRIGVNTGEVVAGDPATGSTFVTGDAVNLAKRLQEGAAPDEILIGRATHLLVQNAVIAGPREPLNVKGKLEPVTPFRIERVEADAAGFARRLDTPLVGRARELAVLQAEFDAAVRERRCRLCTVLGAAGIGKSRLLAELVASLATRATALAGRCLPYGDGITFWPLTEIVYDIDLDTALAEAEDGLAVAEQVRATIGAGTTASGADATFWAVRRLFETIAAARPLVLCFEDIHWAEPTFLDLVEYLAGWIRDAPVLVVCLARPDLIDMRPSWAAHPNAQLVALEPLSAGESERLLDVLGRDHPIPRSARARITSAAEGNPLFVEQMVAMVTGDDAGGDAETSVPPSIQALLAERLDRLGPAQRTVVECAAVIGKEFPRGAVVELVPAALRDVVGPELMALVRKELVQPEPSAFAREDGFGFRHALIRDAAYERISKEVRADLHGRFADWMQNRPGERPVELEEIAGYHLERAYLLLAELGPVDSAARALAARAGALLGAAGRRAFARDDMPAAQSLLERAIALLGDDDPARGALLVELASALMKAGEFPGAARALDDAARTADARGDRPLALRVALERQFLRSFTAPEGAKRDHGRIADELIPELERAGDHLGLAKAWRLLSETHAIACRWQARADALERALAHARQLSEGRTEASAIVALLAQALHYGPTPVHDAVARCRELLADAEGDPGLRAGLGATLAALRAMEGDFAEARDLYARSVALYEELGLRLRRAVRTLVGAEIEILAGDLEAAERELRLGYETLESMGERGVRAVVAAFLADVVCMRGDTDEAERLAGIAEACAEADDVAPHALRKATLARVLAARGDAAAAEASASEAIALADGTDFLGLRANALLALADSVTASARHGEARRLRSEALRLYEAKGNTTAAHRLAAVLDDPAAGASTLEAAAISSPAPPRGGPHAAR